MSSAGRRRHRQRADGHTSRRSVVAAIGDCLGLSLCPCFARHALAAGDQRTVRYGADHIEVDLAAVRRGESLLVEAKTTPIIIRHRTRKEISAARQARSGDLKDPEADEDRVIRPEWLVVHGLCTHLHCPLLEGLGKYGGWLCPCHGAVYDTSGRVRSGPAPKNLPVPCYEFTSEYVVRINRSRSRSFRLRR